MGRVLFEWARAGLESLRREAAVTVIVDVLSFCTAVDVAVSRGAQVIPSGERDPDAIAQLAQRLNAKAAATRRDAAGWTLSPASLERLPTGTRLVLPSPNGSALSAAAGPAIVFAACLRNADAVARAARLAAQGGDIAVIAAGERWPDSGLRPAIEDLLGAGAVVDALAGEAAPEAEVAAGAWRAGRDRVADLVAGSVSGRELIDRGFPRDVDLACAIGVSPAAPRLSDGAFGR